jgi:alkylation response protein AidB-like acyl-CoA dehydrogenase
MADSNAGAGAVSDRLPELVAAAAEPMDDRAFLGRQFDLGLGWVHFRAGEGGVGAAPMEQHLVDRAVVAAGRPLAFHVNPLGIGMVAPSIHDHGTPKQRQRFLRPLFTSAEIWCQLFSEPGAGSDLASVATMARRTGTGDWTINGAKVWTSYAHTAARGLLLARTDPDVPKHRGMTAFLLDMSLPGVEVRPLYQMTGEAEFNEVVLTDVVISDDDRLGEVGAGWQVALTTLMNERVAIGGQVPAAGDGLVGEIVRLWNERGGARPELLDDLMVLWTQAEALRLFNLRAAAARGEGQSPGPEGFIAKVVSAELNVGLTSFAMDLLGPEGLLKPEGYPLARATRSPFDYGGPQHEFLRARANSIEGGTSEIARNVIGERLLGLPAEPRVDKDIPWSKVRRG